MAIAKTSGLKGNNSLLRAISGGVGIDAGTIAMDSSYISNGGEAIDMLVDKAKVVACLLGPWRGYTFEYRKSTGKIVAYGVDPAGPSGPLVELATATNLAAWSDIPYILVFQDRGR